ncbi:MAG: hypothetical protein ABH871_08050 [Pseudomonadota bacterium]
MPDLLKKISSLFFTEQTSHEKSSEEDVQRVKDYLEQILGCELFPICSSDGTVILVSNEGEFVAEIMPDGTVRMLKDDCEFHVADLNEDEEEESYWDWLSFWQSWFSEELKSEEPIWAPNNCAQTQNNAAKFSTPETYTESYSPQSKINEEIKPEAKIPSDEPKQDVNDNAEIESANVACAPVDEENPCMATVPPEGVVSNTDESPFLTPKSPLVEISPQLSMPDARSSVENVLVDSAHKVRDVTNADSLHKTSITNTADVICASVIYAMCEDKPKEEAVQDGQSSKPNPSMHYTKDDAVVHESSQPVSQTAMPQEGEHGNRTPSSWYAAHKVLPSDIEFVPGAPKGKNLASSHFTDQMLNGEDPFANVCLQAKEGGLPPFIHVSSALAVASLSDTSLRDIVLAARDSEGHNERQGHDRDEDDRGSNGDQEHADDSDDEDGSVLAIS